MEINTVAAADPPRAAATVVMLRDAPGLEVFLIQRHGLSDVLGGAHVFPGGKVDAADSSPELTGLLDRPASALHSDLHENGLALHEAAALYVAAAREAFEETGVLYAAQADANLAREASDRAKEGQDFGAVAAGMGLRLSASALRPWSRWITPLVGGVIRKRFDTRFFVATLPAGQEAAHDNHEATQSMWIAPREALLRYWEGDIALAPPQIMSLVHLARHADVEAVLAQAAATPPPLVLPESFEEDGTRVLCYPGDPRHSTAGRALPGPTRLYVRKGRFEPAGGFDSFFSKP